MKSLKTLVLLLALGLPAYGQAVNVTANKIKGSATAPSGACSAQQVQLTTAGVVYVCASGTWTSSGGGTTINSTNGQVPYRVNSTTFGDSAFASNALNSTYLSATSGASGAGLTLTVAGGGTNEALTVTPKGAGLMTIGTTSGGVVLNGGAYTTGGGNNGIGIGWQSPGVLGVISGGYIGFVSSATEGRGATDTAIARASGGVLRITNGSTGAGKLLVGTSTDSATGCQLCVYTASSTEAGLKLSALTGTGAAQQVIQSYNAAGATLTYAVRADGVEFQNGVTFANLPGTPSNGMYLYCSDCTVTSGADNTATSGGSGAFVVRLNGVWRAFATQN